ncbi:unnamed protein product [Acanthocheilonema viteae]|uniref:Uncharacterized protein n=1 Tax=Acanthocheilonema viteae TaxID=6277 RepID=A0A498SYW5_ACAVI|nr:unnamed protein product [Acanthocheilonema viteae]
MFQGVVQLKLLCHESFRVSNEDDLLIQVVITDHLRREIPIMQPSNSREKRNDGEIMTVASGANEEWSACNQYRGPSVCTGTETYMGTNRNLNVCGEEFKRLDGDLQGHGDIHEDEKLL